MAESFGTDARRYDQARPNYPDDLVARVVAGSPGRDVLDVGSGTGIYRAGYAKIAEQIRETERFDEPEQWRFDWERRYPRDQWLNLLPTTGGLTRLRSDQLSEVLGAVGNAIDALGGHFTMRYTTLATTAVRTRTN